MWWVSVDVASCGVPIREYGDYPKKTKKECMAASSLENIWSIQLAFPKVVYQAACPGPNNGFQGGLHTCIINRLSVFGGGGLQFMVSSCWVAKLKYLQTFNQKKEKKNFKQVKADNNSVLQYMIQHFII